MSCAVWNRLQWRSAVVWGAARTLLRHLVDAAGTHSQRWTPRCTPSSVWQALLTPRSFPRCKDSIEAFGGRSRNPQPEMDAKMHSFFCLASSADPEVVPTLAEVLRAWCWLLLVLTLLSPGVLPLPIIGVPRSDGISVPSADPRERGFVLLYPGSVCFPVVM